MKRFLSMILIIALVMTSVPINALAETRVEYPSVNVVLLKSNAALEKEYREWAAVVIWNYYHAYARYDSYPSYEMIEFDRNMFDQYQGQYFFKEFNGIFREYYMASFMKYEFDINVQKTDYSVVIPDEGTEAWREQQKEFYMLMLADAIQEKVSIDPDAFKGMDAGKKGIYTLQMDEKTGMLTMVYDENSVMGNLEQIAEMRTEEALGSFLIDSIDLAVTAAYEYTKLNRTPSEDDDFIDVIINEMIDVVVSVLETCNTVEHQNNINRAMNNIQKIHQEYIANAVLQSSNRIVGYLERIYNGDVRDYVNYSSDPLFLEAVQEMIEIINKGKRAQAEGKADPDFFTELETNKKLKNILSGPEILEIILAEVLVQVANGLFSVMQVGYRKNAASRYEEAEKNPGNYDDLLIELLLNLTMAAVKTYLSEVTKTIFAEMQKPDRQMLRALFNVDNLMVKIQGECNAELLKFVTELEKDSQAMKNISTIGGELNEIIFELIDIYQKNGEKFTEKDSPKLALLVIEALTVIFSVAAKENFDAEAYAEEYGKEAADEMLEKYDIVKSVLGVWDKMMDVAESGAKLVYNALDEMRGENQDAYRAKYMYCAFAASKAIAMDLKTRFALELDANLEKIPEKVKSSELSLETIRKITDMIQMQIEYDMVGTRWLAEILGSNESRGKMYDSNYYEFMIDAVKKTNWESRMTSEVALHEYEQMLGQRNAYQMNWREEFDDLF